MVFDLNDFDETLPGPFEWDVKRLVASFVVAARSNGHRPKQQRAAARATAAAYRTTTAEAARMRFLDVWYARIDANELLAELTSADAKAGGKGSRKRTRGRAWVRSGSSRNASTAAIGSSSSRR